MTTRKANHGPGQARNRRSLRHSRTPRTIRSPRVSTRAPIPTYQTSPTTRRAVPLTPLIQPGPTTVGRRCAPGKRKKRALQGRKHEPIHCERPRQHQQHVAERARNTSATTNAGPTDRAASGAVEPAHATPPPYQQRPSSAAWRGYSRLLALRRVTTASRVGSQGGRRQGHRQQQQKRCLVNGDSVGPIRGTEGRCGRSRPAVPLNYALARCGLPRPTRQPPRRKRRSDSSPRCWRSRSAPGSWPGRSCRGATFPQPGASIERGCGPEGGVVDARGCPRPCRGGRHGKRTGATTPSRTNGRHPPRGRADQTRTAPTWPVRRGGRPRRPT
jgi:hypothetical protein